MSLTTLDTNKPAVIAADIRRGTVLLSPAGKPMLVLSIDFYDDHEKLVLSTRLFGTSETLISKVDMEEALPLASINTAEFLLWEFSGYATLEAATYDRRYVGQLAE